jgi:hypothetical protein
VTTIHLLYATGAVAEVETTQAAEDYTPPEGATVITAEDYATRLADIQADNQAAVDQALAEEAQQRQEDYEALLALNVPEATARRLSGYTGPEL